MHSSLGVHFWHPSEFYNYNLLICNNCRILLLHEYYVVCTECSHSWMVTMFCSLLHLWWAAAGLTIHAVEQEPHNLGLGLARQLEPRGLSDSLRKLCCSGNKNHGDLYDLHGDGNHRAASSAAQLSLTFSCFALRSWPPWRRIDLN
jgi:hypothetical protein